MGKPKRIVSRAAAVCASAAAMALGTVMAPAAHADAPEHYYIEIGGTGNALPADQGCTRDYQAANAQLDGVPVPVCYPATAGPFIGGLTAPNYDASANEGYQRAMEKVDEVHRDHPDALLTITGYSQGAQIADQVLQTLVNRPDIPNSQVNGMLYADPMQPGTGFAARIPKGVGALGFTSPGAGPDNFGGIPVRRFCIHTDGVCDATSLESVGGYFTLHPTYPANYIPQTLKDNGRNGIQWLP
ncbi:PE-PPE domain-containing protein [Streptomyces sp. RGM 3693]|uniref:PE-PPE domain-containing protein n=1 Tax=Streptomyces sp. RGM 3693 TaxID=3413284 RepID=UPI003D2CF8A1